MLHPDALSEIARLRHEDYLKQAEAERLYQQLKGNRPSLLQRVSHLVRVARQRLEVPAPSQPLQPAVRSITDQFKQVR